MLPAFAGPAVFALDPRLEADTLPVGDLALASVLLLNDARFPWFVLVPRRPDATELTDLSDARRRGADARDPHRVAGDARAR